MADQIDRICKQIENVKGFDDFGVQFAQYAERMIAINELSTENQRQIINILENEKDTVFDTDAAAAFACLKRTQLERSDCPRHVRKIGEREITQYLKSEIIKWVKG